MDIAALMSGPETAKLKVQVDSFNKSISGGREVKQTLGRDDFLKILLTQLTHQDPTAPLEDREFVAQMAQFSTLEQMTNMGKDFSRLAELVSGTRALSLLGRQVELLDGESMVTGRVTGVRDGENPSITVNGKEYDLERVEKVME